MAEHALQDGASPESSEFEQELLDYMKALRLPAASAHKAESLCRQHDFSSACVHLIISRPGYHSGVLFAAHECHLIYLAWFKPCSTSVAKGAESIMAAVQNKIEQGLFGVIRPLLWC